MHHRMFVSQAVLGSQTRSGATVTCAWEALLPCKCQGINKCASYLGEKENLGCGKRGEVEARREYLFTVLSLLAQCQQQL